MKYALLALTIGTIACGSANADGFLQKDTPITAKGFFCGDIPAAKKLAVFFNTGEPTLEATINEITTDKIPCALAEGNVLYQGVVDTLTIEGIRYSIDALKVGEDVYYTFRTMQGIAI